MSDDAAAARARRSTPSSSGCSTGSSGAGNKMPDPAILFLVALRRGDRPLADPVLVRRQGDVRGRQAAARCRPRRPTTAARPSRPTSGRRSPSRPTAYHRSRRRRRRCKGLLTGDGVRYLFTSFVSNFRNFSAVTIILVVMIGVGLAEAAGLIAALIRKLVGVSSTRHADVHHRPARDHLEHRLRRGLPRADPARRRGLQERRPQPVRRDRRGLRRRRRGLRRELPDHAARRRADRDHERRGRRRRASQHIDLAANLYFGIGSTIFVAFVLTFITARLVENRLGAWDPADAGEGIADGRRDARDLAGGRGARPALRAVGDARRARSRSRC